MTTDNQIRGEKLQYDVNRETAKISAWSSGKMTSMTVTSKEILPSNQRQTIEQAKFAYSPLVKAFEKQTKTIEDQGKKQTDALKDLKLKQQTKATEDKSDNKLSMQKENYDRLLSERVDKIRKIRGEINYNKLIYRFKFY